MIWRASQKHARVKPKQKIKLEHLGLAPLEQPEVPIEEIRRQGMMLAGRTVGHGVRSRIRVQNGATSQSIGTTRRGSKSPPEQRN